MNPVKNNPYRTLGLFGNSSEKELQKQIATIKRFAEVGKSKSFDYDFPFWGNVVRNTEIVQDAASRIEQAKNKVLYALFWFLNNSHIDELALNNLKDGNLEKAEEIWDKTLKDLTINNKNFSAACNLSTLQLAIVTNNGSFDPEKFLSSIELKGKLLTSSSFYDFISTVAGEGISINTDIILKEFVDQVLELITPYILKPTEKSGLVQGVSDNGIGLYRWADGDLYVGEYKDNKRTGFGIYLWPNGSCYYGYWSNGNFDGEGIYLYNDGTKQIGKWVNKTFQDNGDSNAVSKRIKSRLANFKGQCGFNINFINPAQLIASFRNYPTEIRQYISGKFTEKPLNNIQNAIDSTRQRRGNNPIEAAKYGEDLYSKNKSDLNLLKSILGESNVQYQMITNKLAQEILQCSIDYFNKLNDSGNIDPGDRALKLLKTAKSLNPTGQVKSRIQENEEVIQEWVDDKPERERNNKIQQDLEFVSAKLERFQSLPDSLATTKDLIMSCKSGLQNIRIALGSTDDFYIKISSAVVHNALNAIISVVNTEQRQIQYDRTKIASLFTTTLEAIELLNTMAGMDMDVELRSRFNQNRSTITSIQSSIKQLASSYNRTQSRSSGCYIATMVYGNYDHPQVMVLRNFRDNVLSKSGLGIEFIELYYKYSPRVVEKLKDKPVINEFIKTILNIFIKILR